MELLRAGWGPIDEVPSDQGRLWVLTPRESPEPEGTSKVHPTSTRPTITVTTDGAGVASHAGSRLLADLGDATTLTAELGGALATSGRRRAHDPGRVLVDMAVAVADGARTISDVAVLEHQPVLFGPVASDSTCWRLLDRVDTQALAERHCARCLDRPRR